MPDAFTTINAASSIISALRGEVDLLKDFLANRSTEADPEALELAGRMQSILFELQGRFLELNQERIELVEKLRVAEEKLETRSKLIRRNSCYEFAEPVEGYGKGPFCLQCTDVGQLPIGVPVSASGHFVCSKCGAQGYLAGKEEEYKARLAAANAKHDQERKDYWKQ